MSTHRLLEIHRHHRLQDRGLQVRIVSRKTILSATLGLTALYWLVWHSSHRFLVGSQSEWLLVTPNNHTQNVMSVSQADIAEEVWNRVQRRQLTGHLLLFDARERKRAEYIVTNGFRDGFCRLWLPDGQQITDGTYVAGRLHGPYTTWHNNGTLAHTGAYCNGALAGEHVSWYASGRIARRQAYSNGLIHGVSRIWDQSGKLLEDAVYDKMVPLRGVVITTWDGKGPPVLNNIEPISRPGARSDGGHE